MTAIADLDCVDVHFVEIDTDGLSTDTRVVLAIVRMPSSSGDGDYPVIAGLATFDDTTDTIEVVRVDTGWRRQGLGRALITAAEVAADRPLGPSREFSRPGKALWRSAGRTVPRGSYTARTDREGESYGAMLMAVVLGAQINGNLTTTAVLSIPVHARLGSVTVALPGIHRPEPSAAL